MVLEIGSIAGYQLTVERGGCSCPELPLFLEPNADRAPGMQGSGELQYCMMVWSPHGPHISKLVAGMGKGGFSHVRLQKLDLLEDGKLEAGSWKLEAGSEGISLELKKREEMANEKIRGRCDLEKMANQVMGKKGDFSFLFPGRVWMSRRFQVRWTLWLVCTILRTLRMLRRSHIILILVCIPALSSLTRPPRTYCNAGGQSLGVSGSESDCESEGAEEGELVPRVSARARICCRVS